MKGLVVESIYWKNKNNEFKQVKIYKKVHKELSWSAIGREVPIQELINSILINWLIAENAGKGDVWLSNIFRNTPEPTEKETL